MTEPPFSRPTGSINVQDDEGTVITLTIISRFIDASDMHTQGAREWSENKKKKYFDSDNREFEMIDGHTDQFACADEPDRVFTKVDH
jgi:hypothetical protein